MQIILITSENIYIYIYTFKYNYISCSDGSEPKYFYIRDELKNLQKSRELCYLRSI